MGLFRAEGAGLGPLTFLVSALARRGEFGQGGLRPRGRGIHVLSVLWLRFQGLCKFDVFFAIAGPCVAGLHGYQGLANRIRWLA